MRIPRLARKPSPALFALAALPMLGCGGPEPAPPPSAPPASTAPAAVGSAEGAAADPAMQPETTVAAPPAALPPEGDAPAPEPEAPAAGEPAVADSGEPNPLYTLTDQNDEAFAKPDGCAGLIMISVGAQFRADSDSLFARIGPELPDCLVVRVLDCSDKARFLAGTMKTAIRAQAKAPVYLDWASAFRTRYGLSAEKFSAVCTGPNDEVLGILSGPFDEEFAKGILALYKPE